MGGRSDQPSPSRRRGPGNCEGMQGAARCVTGPVSGCTSRTGLASEPLCFRPRRGISRAAGHPSFPRDLRRTVPLPRTASLLRQDSSRARASCKTRHAFRGILPPDSRKSMQIWVHCDSAGRPRRSRHRRSDRTDACAVPAGKNRASLRPPPSAAVPAPSRHLRLRGTTGPFQTSLAGHS